MNFREADKADAEGIASLHATSWRFAYRGSLSDAYLDGPIEAERSAFWRGRFERPAENQFVVVAEFMGKLVGFACAYGGEDLKWGTFLDNLHVAPERHRKGIGARLMAEVASWSAASFPGQGIYLWVLESNQRARRFYERVGAEIGGRDLWTPPDGTALPKLRLVWRSAGELSAGVADIPLDESAA